MQRQQFDLPQPILSLGGRAKIVLVGMAQRQTLPPTMGDTANHYHICISYAALIGSVLLCNLADRATDCPPSQSCSNTDATSVGNVAIQKGVAVNSSARGGSLAQGGRTARGVGKEERPGVRLRWMLSVVVHHAVPKNRETAGYKPDFGDAPLNIMSYSDTPCLEFLELYGRHHARGGPKNVRLLLLAGDSEGRAFPADDGAVLGDFAAHGRLELVDLSHDSCPR